MFLATIATIGSLLGALLGAKGKPFEMNLIWTFANLIWIYLGIIESSSTLILFILYEIIALYGVYNLWPKKYK